MILMDMYWCGSPDHFQYQPWYSLDSILYGRVCSTGHRGWCHSHCKSLLTYESSLVCPLVQLTLRVFRVHRCLWEDVCSLHCGFILNQTCVKNMKMWAGRPEINQKHVCSTIWYTYRFIVVHFNKEEEMTYGKISKISVVNVQSNITVRTSKFIELTSKIKDTIFYFQWLLFHWLFFFF